MSEWRSFYEREGSAINRYAAEGPWTRNYHLKRMKLVTDLLKSNLINCNSFSDIGCGTGEYIGVAGKQVVENVGMDISSTCLQRAKIFKSKHSHLVLSSLGNDYLPFQDSSFDFVLCSEVLEHLEVMDKAINELFRISRKIILITLPVRGILRKSFGSFPKIEKKLNSVDQKVGHINILELNNLCNKINRKNWDINPITSWNYCEPMESLKLPLLFSSVINSVQSLFDSIFPYGGNAAIIFCERKNND